LPLRNRSAVTNKMLLCGTVRAVFDKPLKIIFMGFKIDRSRELKDTFPW